MKYEVIRQCMIKGSKYGLGDIVEIDDATAKLLMSIGRVIPSDRPSKVEDPVLDDRAIGFSDESPIKKRGRPRKAGTLDNAS